MTGKSNNRIGGSDLGVSSALQLFNCILRLGSGEKQLVVSGINDATKGGITPRTFKAITFKPALVDMWCDTSIETKMQAAIRARHDLERLCSKRMV